MRVLDQSLLSSTAPSTPQSSQSSSRRSRDEDSSFNDVYSKTSAAKDRRSEYASANRRKEAANNEGGKAVERDPSQREATETSETATANNDGDNAKVKAENVASQNADNVMKREALAKALVQAQNMNEAALEKLAGELGVSAEDLAAALEELAKGVEKQVSDTSVPQMQGAQQVDESDIAALFRLLVAQKSTTDHAKAGQGTDETPDDESQDVEKAVKGADATPSADDIADILNALSNGTKTQSEKAVSPQSEGAATTFRFERADGKGVPVELQIGGLKEGDALENGQASTKTENVTVLDARRYLAPTDVNASNIVTNITGDKSWTAAMKAAPTANVPNLTPEKVITEVNTLKIQMHPEDLGTVTATLRLKGNDLIVSMSVHNAEAYNQLNADKDKIMQSLKAQGFSVDQINVQFSATPDRGVQQSASSQQHQSGQQMSGGADGGAARQEQQDGNRRQQTNGQNTFQTVEDVAVSGGGAASGDGGTGAGQIYI